MPANVQQLEFGLERHDADSNPDLNKDGLTQWHAERDAAAQGAAAELGLPVGRPVEIWLRGGIRLRGVLRLRDTVLVVEESAAWKLELEVDNVSFRPSEIESCVRLD
jgi:hypothetical protein